LAHCTAWPAAPFTRLSRAASTTSQPVRGSTAGGQVHAVGPGRRLRGGRALDDHHEGLAVVGLAQHVERVAVERSPVGLA
jgi:hypothetical protein